MCVHRMNDISLLTVHRIHDRHLTIARPFAASAGFDCMGWRNAIHVHWSPSVTNARERSLNVVVCHDRGDSIHCSGATATTCGGTYALHQRHLTFVFLSLLSTRFAFGCNCFAVDRVFRNGNATSPTPNVTVAHRTLSVECKILATNASSQGWRTVKPRTDSFLYYLHAMARKGARNGVCECKLSMRICDCDAYLPESDDRFNCKLFSWYCRIWSNWFFKILSIAWWENCFGNDDEKKKTNRIRAYHFRQIEAIQSREMSGAEASLGDNFMRPYSIINLQRINVFDNEFLWTVLIGQIIWFSNLVHDFYIGSHKVEFSICSNMKVPIDRLNA